MITNILLVAILILSVIILFILFFKSTKIESKDIENALIKAWQESKLSDRIGELNTHAKEIKEMHKSIERMLRVPTERGAFGELSLETILSDQLPPDTFGIRKRILKNKIPDAYIKSTVGIICIDSKFPLENYRKMMETEDPKEKKILKERFLKDVERHLEKVANDYISLEEGTAEFAFVYIPSEGVYWFLVKEGFELLRNYTKKGIQVVSPLTLSHKIELIKAGIHAQKLSENITVIKNELFSLAKEFENVENIWKIFYETHLKNAINKAEEVDNAYKRLKEAFKKILNLTNKK